MKLLSPFFVALIILYLFVELMGIDFWLAQKLYQLEGHHWSLRDHWLTFGVLHSGGRILMISAGVILLSFCVLPKRFRKWGPSRREFALLFLSCLSCVLLIGLLKKWTHMDCPWDLVDFGGSNPFIPLWQKHPGTFPYGRGWPAGHVSGIYCWLGLAWFQSRHGIANPRKTILVVCVLGVIFGLGQQLRGAHFLSHDLATAIICWFLSGLFFQIPQLIEVRSSG